MSEELLEYENTVEGPDGHSWIAAVMGAKRPDGRWVGWIRFRAPDGEALRETERETTQPNRDGLVHWAKGLTYYYLEGALARATRRIERRQADRGADQTLDMASPPPGGGPRLEVLGASAKVIQQVTGTTKPRAGRIREVADAGAVVYEGSSGSGDGAAHYFALRFSSRNSGAVLSNWLWSRIHGSGATVRVDGQGVELTQDALSHAIAGE